LIIIWTFKKFSLVCLTQWMMLAFYVSKGYEWLFVLIGLKWWKNQILEDKGCHLLF
jgi:hypothetical protein